MNIGLLAIAIALVLGALTILSAPREQATRYIDCGAVTIPADVPQELGKIF